MRKRGHGRRPKTPRNLEKTCRVIPKVNYFSVLQPCEMLQKIKSCSLGKKRRIWKVSPQNGTKNKLSMCNKTWISFKALSKLLMVVQITVGGCVKIRATTSYKGFKNVERRTSYLIMHNVRQPTAGVYIFWYWKEIEVWLILKYFKGLLLMLSTAFICWTSPTDRLVQTKINYLLCSRGYCKCCSASVT